MKLEKAIEISQDTDRAFFHEFNQDQSDAIRILIEAGKRLQTYRDKKYYYARSLLPGETEE